ncbi:hypothetical protein G9A89_023952 [Geosiphon pyriformis]|nr:hypothetical protein G9A89_023952 [Geosiphon pyriformis]
MASAKAEGTMPEEIQEIKDNSWTPEYNGPNVIKNVNLQPTDIYNIQKKKPKISGNICNNKFKVATTPDTITLEYHQSIYTHCKQRFNIPDGIEVKLEATSTIIYKTLATYFQELNFNIIEYCEEKYPVQPKYFFNFESETETSNKSKQKIKQYSRTTPNTPILPKTTAKHLQTPEQETNVKLPLSITPFLISLVQPQTPSSLLNHFSRPEDFQSPRNPTQQQEPISTSANIIDYLQENESNYSESLESEETEQKPEEATENKEEMATAYIAKISEFMGKDNDTSPQEWLNKVQKAGDANEELFENWQAFKDAFLQQFTDNNTSITLKNCFHNIKQETSETFIVGLKDKLIKKVCSHVLADLATAIRHAKNYEMAMEEANHTKLVNLAIRETSSVAEKKIDQLTKKIESYFTNQQQHDTTKTTLDHHSTTNLKIVTIVEFQDTGNKIAENYKKTNKTRQPLPIQQYQTPPIQQYQVPARKLVQHNQFTPQNQFQNNNNRINPNNQLVLRNSGQQKPNHYHTQSSYLIIPEESDFQQSALSEGKVVALRSNPSNNTIPLAQIAQNANLSDIFPFEFEANESPFLLSNAAANEQKAITVMYTEATVEKKPIRLILDSGSAGSIITYQPAQTVIVIADGMKKTPVGEIDNFSFTIDRITIPVKVLIMNTPQYQALIRNNWLLKANANLDWKTQELKILYQGQYTIVPATFPVFEFEEEKEMPLTETYMALGSTSNWSEKTEQEIFEESRGWKKVRYSSPEPWKQPPYIPLKCKDCNKKLSSMRAYMLPEECNWIDVAMRRGVCNQICQYALSISEKVRRGTPFDAAYNSALNKLYHYPHDAEMIFNLTMTLINRATQEDVHQMKEAEYIEYTMELAGFDYENEAETYYQIASHTYPTKEAQIQQLEQINIQLCKEYIIIPLPNKNDENEIEFEVSELVEKLPTTLIYLLEKQPSLQLKYFDNHSQGIRPEKAHKIDAGYDLRYPEKDTLVLQPKFLTKINLKIALEIPPGAMVQIASRLSLASKGINIREGVIDAGYTGDITIML